MLLQSQPWAIFKEWDIPPQPWESQPKFMEKLQRTMDCYFPFAMDLSDFCHLFLFYHVLLPWNFFGEVWLINTGVSNTMTFVLSNAVVGKGQPWWSTPWKRCLEKKALKLSAVLMDES